MRAPIASSQKSSPPLCVDLDGTLIRTDMLCETLMRLAKKNPLYALAVPFWLLRGRAHLKREVAGRVNLDATVLPYHEPLVEFLRIERKQGRSLVLVTAADDRLAQKVAEHLAIFDAVIASNGEMNLRGKHKARQLTERFGARGFDYAGNSTADLPVWREARQAIVVNGTEKLERSARKLTPVSRVFKEPESTPAGLLKALRPHQWVKNVIVFVPLLTSHRLGEPRLLAGALLAFLSFSLCASGVYVLNDLLDLEADRHHPAKRLRPFASGQLQIPTGIVLVLACVLLSAVVGWCLSWGFLLMLASYVVLTSLYSWRMKQIVLLDVFFLAGLYTSRLVAGHAATQIEYSFWLLAFSMFIFLSLALVKRFAEPGEISQQNKPGSMGRGYLADDLELVATIGLVTGCLAVLVMALYVHSQEVIPLYHYPNLLLFICPLLLYWICRIWLIAHRGGMHDDPIVFALKDRTSYCVGALILGVLWLAAHH